MITKNKQANQRSTYNMKHLRKYIRNILLEGIKAGEMSELCLYKSKVSMPYGMHFRYGEQYILFHPEFIDAAIGPHGKRADATGHKALANNSGLLAMMQLVPPLDECNDVSGVVKLAAARPGWGPTMYDIVMTDQPNGIMADRVEVSDDAYGVWDYYRENRKDVDYKTLDWKYAQWTKNSSDDCDWGSKGDYYDKGGWDALMPYVLHKEDPDDEDNLLPMDPVDVKTGVSFIDFLSDPLNYTYNLTNGPISQTAIDAALARGNEAVQQIIEVGIPANEPRWWRELGRAFFRSQVTKRS